MQEAAIPLLPGRGGVDHKALVISIPQIKLSKPERGLRGCRRISAPYLMSFQTQLPSRLCTLLIAVISLSEQITSMQFSLEGTGECPAYLCTLNNLIVVLSLAMSLPFSVAGVFIISPTLTFLAVAARPGLAPFSL